MIQKFLFSVVLACSSLYAGAQWAVVDTVNQANYYSIHFWDAQHGIVGGETAGRFFNTSNSGSSWTTVQAPFTFPLMKMQFVDAVHGFACGGSGFSAVQNVLVGTADAGLTWDTLSMNVPNAIEFAGLSFKNKDTGIVFGYSSLFGTFDGGHTLVSMHTPDTNFYLQDVVLLPDNSLLATGSLLISSSLQLIYRSTNWGATWQMVYSTQMGITSLAVKDGLGVATSSQGRILITNDNGLTWSPSQIASDTVIFVKAKFGGDGAIYLLADKAGDGYLYGSNDGIAWQSSLVAPNEYVIDLSMPTKQIGFVITYRKVYRTITGGGMTLSVTNAPTETDAIDVYPNPAYSVINIRNRSGIELTSVALFDATGRIVKKLNGETKTINTSGLPKGIYLLELNTADRRSTRKVVIE